MLLVSTYLDKSPVHGIGLFVFEQIPAGTLVWQFRKDFDQVFRKEDVDNLPEPAREYLLNYAYVVKVRGEVYHILCAGNNKFVNHSAAPNTICVGFRDGIESGKVYASRDIQAREEILEDYNSYDDSGRILRLMVTGDDMGSQGT
jgi:hypothetical protein